MRMIKSIVFLLLLFSLIACQTQENVESSNQNSYQLEELGQIPIKVWLDDAQYGQKLELSIEQKYPDIDLIWEVVESASARNNVELDGPAGKGPDIFIQPHDNMAQSVKGNILLPLNESLASHIEERFIESAAHSANFEGLYYGFPLSTETVALFYNQSLLDKYGLDVATTFEEIKAQGDLFNDKSMNRFIIRYEVGNAYTMHFFLTAFGFELFGPTHDNVSDFSFNQESIGEALSYYASMKEYLPLHFSELTVETVEKEFAKGTVPYAIIGPWAISEIKSNALFNWGVTTIPKINDVQPVTFSGNIIACISAYTKYPNESQKVLEFMSSDEGLEILYQVRGTIPALKNPELIKGLAEDEYVKGILEQAQYSEPMPSITELGSYWFPAEMLFRSVWTGMLTPEESMILASQEFDEVLYMFD